MLKRKLFQYQGNISAALVLGGFDCNGPSLYTVYPHGSTDSLPYVTMGSGSLAAMARCAALSLLLPATATAAAATAAMATADASRCRRPIALDASTTHPHSRCPPSPLRRRPSLTSRPFAPPPQAVFEAEYKDAMSVEEAKALVQAAIMSGINNDLGSGGSVDMLVINKDGNTVLRNVVRPNERKFRKVRRLPLPRLSLCRFSLSLSSLCLSRLSPPPRCRSPLPHPAPPPPSPPLPQHVLSCRPSHAPPLPAAPGGRLLLPKGDGQGADANLHAALLPPHRRDHHALASSHGGRMTRLRPRQGRATLPSRLC